MLCVSRCRFSHPPPSYTQRQHDADVVTLAFKQNDGKTTPDSVLQSCGGPTQMKTPSNQHIPQSVFRHVQDGKRQLICQPPAAACVSATRPAVVPSNSKHPLCTRTIPPVQLCVVIQGLYNSSCLHTVSVVLADWASSSHGHIHTLKHPDWLADTPWRPPSSGHNLVGSLSRIPGSPRRQLSSSSSISRILAPEKWQVPCDRPMHPTDATGGANFSPGFHKSAVSPLP